MEIFSESDYSLLFKCNKKKNKISCFFFSDGSKMRVIIFIQKNFIYKIRMIVVIMIIIIK